jgi:hypothetical protein
MQNGRIIYLANSKVSHTEIIDLSLVISCIPVRLASLARPWKNIKKFLLVYHEKLAIEFLCMWLKVQDVGSYVTITHEFAIKIVIRT